MRARVRFVRDYECRNVDPGTVMRWRAGDEDILVYWQRSHKPGGIWATEYGIDEAHLVPADVIHVVEVLEP